MQKAKGNYMLLLLIVITIVISHLDFDLLQGPTAPVLPVASLAMQ
jgi:hypothetical protein